MASMRPPPATTRRIPTGRRAATILPRSPTPISISIGRPPPITRVKSISTETWLGATPGYFANPRMIYDPVYDRWIFLVTQFRTPADPTHQYLYLAVSQTSDPTGAFNVYQIDVSDGGVSNNTFWDYPQLGLDRNAIIVTGDLYDLDTTGSLLFDSRMFTVAKSPLYNGQAFNLYLFTGLDGTLAPPIVLDENPSSFLVTADCVHQRRLCHPLYLAGLRHQFPHGGHRLHHGADFWDASLCPPTRHHPDVGHLGRPL